MMKTFNFEVDDERLGRLAGLMMLEAVDDEDAWAMFWRAVMFARHGYEHKLGDGPADGSGG